MEIKKHRRFTLKERVILSHHWCAKDDYLIKEIEIK